MKRLRIVVGILSAFIGLTLMGFIAADVPANEATASLLRIGTFDSRAVAFAYARSEMFNTWLRDLRAAASQAEAEGDTARVTELGLEAQDEHALRSKQVFGTFPVYDVLEMIEEDIPTIAAENGVDVIVNKWGVAYQRQGVEFVDVTGSMVDLFGLDEESKQGIQELLQQKPVPWQEWDGLGDHE